MHGEYEADDDKISELRNITKAMQEGYEFYIPCGGGGWMGCKANTRAALEQQLQIQVLPT